MQTAACPGRANGAVTGYLAAARRQGPPAPYAYVCVCACVRVCVCVLVYVCTCPTSTECAPIHRNHWEAAVGPLPCMAPGKKKMYAAPRASHAPCLGACPVCHIPPLSLSPQKKIKPPSNWDDDPARRSRFLSPEAGPSRRRRRKEGCHLLAPFSPFFSLVHTRREGGVQQRRGANEAVCTMRSPLPAWTGAPCTLLWPQTEATLGPVGLPASGGGGRGR